MSSGWSVPALQASVCFMLPSNCKRLTYLKHHMYYNCGWDKQVMLFIE